MKIKNLFFIPIISCLLLISSLSFAQSTQIDLEVVFDKQEICFTQNGDEANAQAGYKGYMMAGGVSTEIVTDLDGNPIDTLAANGFKVLDPKYCQTDYEVIDQCYVADTTGVGYNEGDQLQVIYHIDGLNIVDTTIINSTQQDTLSQVPPKADITPCETANPCEVENIPGQFRLEGMGDTKTFSANTYASITFAVTRGTADVIIGTDTLDFSFFGKTYESSPCEYIDGNITINCKTDDCRVEVATMR